MAKQRRIVHGEAQGEQCGWLVKTGQGYYTGNQRSELERWTAFPQLAKVYHRRGWAQKAAVRLAGQVISRCRIRARGNCCSQPLALRQHQRVASGKR